MNLFQAVEFVESSDVFKDFLKDNPDYYLVHLFTSVVNGVRDPWQVGYYSKDADKIVVFTASDSVTVSKPEDVFKESGVVAPLDLSSVKVSFDDAKSVVDSFLASNFYSDKPLRFIVILQVVDSLPVWNITVVSHSLKMINVRVNASSGEIVSSSHHSLMSLGNFA